MKTVIMTFICVFLMRITGNAYEIKPNMVVIDSIVTVAIQDQIEMIGKDESDSLAIDLVNLGGEEVNYLRVIIGNLARENSFKVIRNYNPASSFQGLVITIDKFEVEVEYSKPFEKTFLGKSYVTRHITTRIRGQVYSNRSKMVLNGIEKNVKRSDDVPYSELEQIDESSYNFTRGLIKEYTFWDKVFEPVLIVSAVSIIIYLLYTQRS